MSGHWEFASRQALDVFSPSNFLLTNPDVLTKTQSEGGQNLVRGVGNLIEDWERVVNGVPRSGRRISRSASISPRPRARSSFATG